MNDEADGAHHANTPVRDYRGIVPALHGITTRQNEMLHWLCEGKQRGHIADILGISPRTVEGHLRVLYDLLGVDNGHGAVAAISHAIEARYQAIIAAILSRRHFPLSDG